MQFRQPSWKEITRYHPGVLTLIRRTFMSPLFCIAPSPTPYMYPASTMAVLATSMFSLLVGATVASYIPQYTRIYSLRSSAGISLTSTLFLALAAQTQLVQMYYLFTIHPDTRHGGVVPKPIKLQDWLNLAQIIAQWTCAVILCVSQCKIPLQPS